MLFIHNPELIFLSGDLIVKDSSFLDIYKALESFLNLILIISLRSSLIADPSLPLNESWSSKDSLLSSSLLISFSNFLFYNELLLNYEWLISSNYSSFFLILGLFWWLISFGLTKELNFFELISLIAGWFSLTWGDFASSSHCVILIPNCDLT